MNIYSLMIIGLIIGVIISYFKIGPKIDYKTAFLIWGFMVSIFFIAFKIEIPSVFATLVGIGVGWYFKDKANNQ